MPETQASTEVVTPSAAPATAPESKTPTPADLNSAAPAVPPAKKEPPLGSRFAALSRRENEIRQQAEKFKSEQEAFKNEQAQFNAERDKMRGLVDAVANSKENPVALLNAAGITYDQLTRFILQDGKPDPMDRIAELDNKIEEEKKARAKEKEDAEAARRAADEKYITDMIDAYRKETDAYIAANPATYELILAYDAQDHVFLKIRDHFAETGKVLSPEDAAKAVEAELEATVEELAKLPKFQAKLKPPEPEKKTETPPKTQARPVPKTLSVQQVSAASPAKSGPLNRDERFKRAMDKLVFVDRK